MGFATRLREGGTGFYARHGGRGSLLGHMVKDARAAVDFLHCRSAAGRASRACLAAGERYSGPYVNTLDKLPVVDMGRVGAAGYSLGGSVALHLAALDRRVQAVAAFAAFTPMRTDAAGRPTGGIRRLYEMHALLPRLGLFDGGGSAGSAGSNAGSAGPAGSAQGAVPGGGARWRQVDVPYDYAELIAAVAPRAALLYTPTGDRDATFADVAECAATAAGAWASKGAAANFTHSAPGGRTCMEAPQAAALVAWMKAVLAVA